MVQRAKDTGEKSNEEKANAVKLCRVGQLRRFSAPTDHELQVLAENLGESFSPHLRGIFKSIISMLQIRNLQIRKECLWTVQTLVNFAVTYWSRPSLDERQPPALHAVSENLADEAIHSVMQIMRKSSEGELTGIACRTLVGIFEMVRWNFMKDYHEKVTEVMKQIMDNNIEASIALEFDNVEYLFSSLLHAVCMISKLWKEHRLTKEELEMREGTSNSKLFRNFFDEVFPNFLEWSSSHQPMWMQRLALGAVGIVFTDIAVSKSSLPLDRYSYYMIPVLNSSLTSILSKFSNRKGDDVDMRLVQNAAACCGIIATHVRGERREGRRRQLH